MAEHRVPLLGMSLRRYEDPAKSRDPRVRSVVTALREVEFAPAPRAHFRAELRAQLVAVAPRLIADGVAAEGAMIDIVPRPAAPEPVAAKPPRGAHLLAGVRSIPIARPLGIVASLIVVFAMLLGGAVWMSRNALPGDALYGLKRASENFELSTAGSDGERAGLYQEFAARRVTEARDLLGRTSALGGTGVQAGGISSQTADYIRSNLASADSDTRSAAQLLGGDAVRADSTKPLAAMTGWAPSQLARLHQLWSALPAGALRDRAVQSRHLVRAALTRAQTLRKQVGCGSLKSDDLGPVPARTCAVTPQHPSTPSRSSKPSHRRTTAPQPVTSHTSRRGKHATSPARSHSGGSSTHGSSASSSHKPPITLPTLPKASLPSLPKPGLTLTKCVLGLNLGTLLNVTIDTCKALGGTPSP